MIKLTAPETYTATIAGIEWQNITPASHMWDEVQERIAGGEEVVEQLPAKPQPPVVQLTPEDVLQELIDAGVLNTTVNAVKEKHARKTRSV